MLLYERSCFVETQERPCRAHNTMGRTTLSESFQRKGGPYHEDLTKREIIRDPGGPHQEF